jgi:hypothetical protein
MKYRLNAQLTRLFGLKKEGANHLSLPRPNYCTEHYSIPASKKSSWSARAKNAAYLAFSSSWVLALGRFGISRFQSSKIGAGRMIHEFEHEKTSLG